MKRTGFSVFHVRSALYGTTFVVNKAAHMDLIARADTSPELSAYELGAPTFEYVFEGKPRRTPVPLSGRRKDGKLVFWDVAQDRYSRESARALEVRRQHAQLQGAEYVLFDNVLGDNFAEAKNRKSAQLMLFQAFGMNTEDIETAALVEVQAGPRAIRDLASSIGVAVSVMTVASLRLWLKGRAQLPMNTELLHPSWLVSRSTGYA
jgi:hypothetical protein